MEERRSTEAIQYAADFLRTYGFEDQRRDGQLPEYLRVMAIRTARDLDSMVPRITKTDKLEVTKDEAAALKGKLSSIHGLIMSAIGEAANLDLLAVKQELWEAANHLSNAIETLDKAKG